MELGLTENGSSMILELILTIVVLGIFCLYKKYVNVPRPSTKAGICDDPSCARCKGEQKFTRDILLSRLLQSNPSNSLEDTMKEVIASPYRQTEIQQDILALSGYKGRIEHVLSWQVPGLTKRSFWRKGEHVTLNDVYSILQTEYVIDGLLKEYDTIKNDDSWLANQTPQGKWKIFSLINQGLVVEENCKCCPFAFKLIKSFNRFMIGNAFCYAMYSSLEPGSTIEPHYGPCNFRLRCHIPLIPSRGFKLHVGMDTVEWKKGEVIVFDDSLVHSVVSEDICADCRVVFIVDIWHPEVDQENQKCLNCLFAT